MNKFIKIKRFDRSGYFSMRVKDIISFFKSSIEGEWEGRCYINIENNTLHSQLEICENTLKDLEKYFYSKGSVDRSAVMGQR